MDGMLGHFRLNVRNVFGIAGAGLVAAVQTTATMRAMMGPMFLAVVDVVGRLSSRSAMAGLGPRPLFVTFAGRFLVGRLHARRRRGCLVRLGRRGCLLLGQSLGQFQEGKDHRLRPLLVDHPRLFFAQRTAAKNIQQIPRQGRLACCHAQ